MVGTFNQTLKAMLRKHAARFGNQWDQYLSSVLWEHTNIPHKTLPGRGNVVTYSALQLAMESITKSRAVACVPELSVQ